MLARAFTGESWSQGLGMVGLGDRVAMRKVRANVGSLEQIIDVDKFRSRLEELGSDENFDQELKGNILVFLEAWRNQEKGDDR